MKNIGECVFIDIKLVNSNKKNIRGVILVDNPILKILHMFFSRVSMKFGLEVI